MPCWGRCSDSLQRHSSITPEAILRCFCKPVNLLFSWKIPPFFFYGDVRSIVFFYFYIPKKETIFHVGKRFLFVSGVVICLIRSRTPLRTEPHKVKLSITLDTLTARVLKLSSNSQSGIEPMPFYSRGNPADCRADSAVTPVAHKISPDHRF